jgi:ligand-binding sensor domain-containing protein/signal transduction histidine kinase
LRSSSTCRSGLRRAIASAIVLIAAARPLAAQPGGDVPAASQYIRDAWGASQGFPGGAVSAIAQTPDGYLWIGTEKGLVRFDGSEFRLEAAAPDSAVPITRVLGLVTDNDGTLWIRLQSARLVRYRRGRFENVIAPAVQAEAGFTAMSRDAAGRVLLSGLRSGLVRPEASAFATLTAPEGMPSSLVISLAEAADGTVWIGTRDIGLFTIRSGQLAAGPQGLPDRKVNALLPMGARDLWIATDSGVAHWDGAALTLAAVPTMPGGNQALAMIANRAGGLWVGTGRGLVRLTADGRVALDERQAETGVSVTALFEDREGNLWVGTPRGIERWRARTFQTFARGLAAESQGPVFADGRGRVWFAPASGGLAWIKGTDVHRASARGLDTDIVYSIAGDASGVWIGRQRGGLTHLRDEDDELVARTYGVSDGLPQESIYAVLPARDGSVWAATLSGGVSRLKDKRLVTYTTADGLASNTVSAMAEDAQRSMWFGTPDGLSSLSGGRWTKITEAHGLPSADVISLYADDDGILWVGTAAGLAYMFSGRVHLPRGAPSSLTEPIHGIAADGRGGLWVATARRVLGVPRAALLAGTGAAPAVREYGLADGLISIETMKRQRSVVADADGRIWFSLNRSLSVVDPSRALAVSPPAIVHLRAVSADGRAMDPAAPLRLASPRQRVTFGFVGLSLSVPERTRFRYRLDGFDTDWSAPTAAREAVYTNLGPGGYTFRVMASNSDGLWNGSEAAVGLMIGRVFWQTWWFRAAVSGTFALMVLGLYRLRLHQMTHQLNVRFEERLAERTRIAQELHDTLLQGFLSASMQLHVATETLPDDSPARAGLTRVAALMRQVIDEGRNAVRGLRSTNPGPYDLEQALSGVQQELGLGTGTGFRVIVEGQPRPLNPIVRDEVYRIGREALVNAFRHAQATTVEVELEYAARHMRMLIRDDGVGIEAEVLKSGTDGHWGLSGMRERAERIGARFKVFSRAAAGTEVELVIPGHIAWK